MKLSHNFRLIEVLPDVPPVVPLDLCLGVHQAGSISDPPSVTRRQGTEGQRDKDWFTVHSGEIHITQAPTWDLRVQCTVYLSTKLGQTVNYQLVFIKETMGYVCDETR